MKDKNRVELKIGDYIKISTTGRVGIIVDFFDVWDIDTYIWSARIRLIDANSDGVYNTPLMSEDCDVFEKLSDEQAMLYLLEQ
jgi:hypothetical protein